MFCYGLSWFIVSVSVHFSQHVCLHIRVYDVVSSYITLHDIRHCYATAYHKMLLSALGFEELCRCSGINRGWEAGVVVV